MDTFVIDGMQIFFSYSFSFHSVARVLFYRVIILYYTMLQMAHEKLNDAISTDICETGLGIKKLKTEANKYIHAANIDFYVEKTLRKLLLSI